MKFSVLLFALFCSSSVFAAQYIGGIYAPATRHRLEKVEDCSLSLRQSGETFEAETHKGGSLWGKNRTFSGLKLEGNVITNCSRAKTDRYCLTVEFRGNEIQVATEPTGFTVTKREFNPPKLGYDSTVQYGCYSLQRLY